MHAKIVECISWYQLSTGGIYHLLDVKLNLVVTLIVFLTSTCYFEVVDSRCVKVEV